MKTPGGKLKIGVLTTFYNLDTAYSLCSIVIDQLTVFKKYGYETVLFVHDNFSDEDLKKVPEGVEVRKIVPRFQLVDYAATSEVAPDFEEQVSTIVEAFNKNVSDIDIMITHDIIFQGWFLPYNAAIRKLNYPNIKWLHWIHSAPSPRPVDLKYPFSLRFTIPDNSKLVYLNHTDALRLAEMYGAWLKDVRVVHNMKDPRTFWSMHPLTRELIDNYPILEADIVLVYAFSSTRMSAKGVHKIIRLMGKFKKLGKKPCAIMCNAHANGQGEKDGIKEMMELAHSCGLDNTEIVFTSMYDVPKWELGVPSQVISDLFRLSNVFIFPSLSENCSLVLLEAALSKNLLVLNEDFAPMKDFFHEQALYHRFGSLISNTEYSNEEQWYEDVAKIILSEMKENKALNSFNIARQKFNMDFIFKNQIEPLFYAS